MASIYRRALLLKSASDSALCASQKNWFRPSSGYNPITASSPQWQRRLVSAGGFRLLAISAVQAFRASRFA
jgi:hypothetical protein